MDHVLWCNRHPLVLPDIVKGEGCYLYDLQGRKYLDLESGIWCLPLGHCHPQIIQKEAIDHFLETFDQLLADMG